VKRMGLQPAGDSGGYFQTCAGERQLDASRRCPPTVSAQAWEDFVPRDPAARPRVDGSQAVYCRRAGRQHDAESEQAAGKFIVIAVRTVRIFLPPRRVNRGALLTRFRSAAGIAGRDARSLPPAGDHLLPPTADDLVRRLAAGERYDGLPAYIYVKSDAGRLLFGAPLDSLRVGAAAKTLRAPCSSPNGGAGPQRLPFWRAAMRRCAGIRRDRRAQRPHRFRSRRRWITTRSARTTMRCGTSSRRRPPSGLDGSAAEPSA